MIIEAENNAPNRMASALRAAGGGAVLLSAIVYLLQGIDHVAIDLRQWMYLALVVGLSAVGVFVRRVLDDAKSARLCFALAGGALTVQVAQVAGMVHELVSGAGTGFWIDFSHTTLATTAISAVLTALVFLPVAFSSFSILHRESRRTLTFGYALAASLLLLPMREGLGAVLVIGALAAVWLAVELRELRGQPAARTLEGYGARVVLALPLLVAIARFGFHVTHVSGVCMLVMLIAGIVVTAALSLLKPGVFRDFLLTGAALSGGGAWLALSDALWHVDTLFLSYVILAPLLAAMLVLGRLMGTLAPLVRVIAVALSVLPVAEALAQDVSFGHAMTLAGLGTALLVWGWLQQERETFVPGVLLALLGAGLAAFEALVTVEVNTWLGLAVGGLMLVVSASVLERHGRNLVHRLHGGWREVAAW